MVAVRQAALVAVYLAAIVAANWSVDHWGPRAAIYNAFLLIALDLVTRDRLHDMWAGRMLWPRLAALVATGSLLSWWLSVDGRIALASGVAFAVGATLDAIAYQAARRLPWFERSNVSNIFGAAGDSVAFQWIAFGWSWPIIFAQFCAKVAGGVVWALVLKRTR